MSDIKHLAMRHGWKQPREVKLVSTPMGSVWYFVPKPDDHPAQNAIAGMLDELPVWEIKEQ